MTINRLVVVTRKTQLEELLERHSTPSQVKFFLESRGDSFDFYKGAHEDYVSGVHRIVKEIGGFRSQKIEKRLLPTYQFAEKDLVVIVGDDGLLVNAAKYLDGQPVISVNPDTKRFDGVLSTCNIDNFKLLLSEAIDGRYRSTMLTMAEAKLEDGQVIYALNDLFIGRNSHASARYLLNYNGISERQSSSGIIVSTGTGSTGWLTSVFKGANAILGTDDLKKDQVPFSRDLDYLLFAVREPFPSKITGTDLVYGKIERDIPLQIFSNMPEGGVIFGDGIEADYIEFNAGKKVLIMPSDKKVNLVEHNEK